MAYTWIPFYKEFAQKLLQFRSNRKPLVDWDVSNLVPDILVPVWMAATRL